MNGGDRRGPLLDGHRREVCQLRGEHRRGGARVAAQLLPVGIFGARLGVPIGFVGGGGGCAGGTENGKDGRISKAEPGSGRLVVWSVATTRHDQPPCPPTTRNLCQVAKPPSLNSTPSMPASAHTCPHIPHSASFPGYPIEPSSAMQPPLPDPPPPPPRLPLPRPFRHHVPAFATPRAARGTGRQYAPPSRPRIGMERGVSCAITHRSTTGAASAPEPDAPLLPAARPASRPFPPRSPPQQLAAPRVFMSWGTAPSGLAAAVPAVWPSTRLHRSMKNG